MTPIRSRWPVLLYGLVLTLSGCGQSTRTSCSIDDASGGGRTCIDFQSGFDDRQAADYCAAQRGTAAATACAAGVGRCVTAQDGLMFTTHYYDAALLSVAQRVCTMVGGTFETS